MHRLPKKLKDSIFSNTDGFPVGWGVHIMESLGHYVTSILVFLGLVITGVLAMLWAVLTRDVQGTFGIGSHCVTVQAACMAMLYFKWSQESDRNVGCMSLSVSGFCELFGEVNAACVGVEVLSCRGAPGGDSVYNSVGCSLSPT